MSCPSQELNHDSRVIQHVAWSLCRLNMDGLVSITLIHLTCLGKSNPITGLDRTLESQEVEAPRFLDNRHMKVVRLSALRTGRLYTPGKITGTHFC
jgi:hypothetical protein